ncbi:hypothetical protein [Anatilimnocola floriformis]|uniref:hypothetical protein n=1 Tax=Anatilimnocola floriformis TaxID=2948575 RepID=UPI0020C36402|nr:hypothetical protein [Anatilimnocola floriformis]
MRSVELALAADYARRGLWIIPVVLLTITALPMWLFAAMRNDGALQPGMREAVVMHVTLTLVMGFGCAIAVYQSHGKLARHFIRPVSSARLVACQMTLGMLTMAAMYAIAAGIINIGGAGWPVLGPAMFLAAALACSLAAIWSLEGSTFAQLLGCIATTAPLVIWFNRCYGAQIIGDWQRMWRQPTAVDALALGGMSLVAFGVATLGVARARRGDVVDLSAVWRWIDRQFGDVMPMGKFASPHGAQAWFEWRQKMAALPALMLGGFFVFACSVWAAGYMPSDELLVISGTMPLIVLIFVMPLIAGLVAGNCSQDSGKPAMRFTLATRPVTDTFIANGILLNCLRSLAMTWAVWLCGWLLIAALLYWAGEHVIVRQAVLPESMSMRHVATIAALSLTISWTLTSLMASLVAAGRAWLIVALLSLVFAVLLGLSLLNQFMPQREFDSVLSAVYVMGGTLFLGFTCTVFVLASRLRLITAWVWAPCVVLFLMAATFLVTNGVVRAEDGPFVWQGVGCLSLTFAPLAAMPMAVHYNRHR